MIKRTIFAKNFPKYNKTMSKSKNTEKDSNIEGFESALTKTEQFVEDNQKTLTSLALGVLIIVSLYLAFQKFYVAP
jgi:hypothetical protein